MEKRTVARRILLSFICLLTVIFVVIHYDSQEYSVQDEQAYINRICEMTNVPAMSVAVWDNGTEIFLNYSSGDDTAIHEKSLYELASATKAFTALGILQLEKEGKLALTDSVNRYIDWFEPEWKGEKAAVTIGQLLEHTSGLPAWTICLIPSGTVENSSLRQTVEKIRGIRLNHEPGRVYEYAAVNYDILALVMETVTGQKFEGYMKENILEPLGMQDSFFRTGCDGEGITQGNKVSFLKTRPFDAPSYYGNIAAGYLVSNTSDLMKWIKNVNKLFEFENFPAANANRYYAGWNVYDTCVCHSGNNPNCSSQVIVSRKDAVGVFALSALSGSSATEAAGHIYRMHMGESVRIGLYIDDSALLDFAGIMTILILLYLALLIRVDSKRKAIGNMLFGNMMLAGIAAFPFASHYSCSFLHVWCPGSFLPALLAGVCFAILQICRGAAWLHGCKRPRSCPAGHS